MKFEFKHRLGIVAIAKNEGPYLCEWLEYHLCAGVSKFYIYDNESSDTTKVILAPYIRRGIVEYTYYPGKQKQLHAYCEALEAHRFDCEYLAFIDIDEFIRPMKPMHIIDAVEAVLAGDNHAKAVVINWRVFGSSGHLERPAGGVLKNFIYRAKDSYKMNYHIKTIMNPRAAWYMCNAHYGFYWNGCMAVNTEGKMISNHWNPVKSISKICIHHYFTKSLAEWKKRRAMGKADSKGIRPLQEFYNDNLDEIYDDSILKYRSKISVLPVICKNTNDKEIDVITILMNLRKAVSGQDISLEHLLCFWHWLDKENCLDEDEQQEFLSMISGLLVEEKTELWEKELLARVLLHLPVSVNKVRGLALKLSEDIYEYLDKQDNNQLDIYAKERYLYDLMKKIAAGY